MEHFALDETLKLLNGLHDDSSKRLEIGKYVQKYGKIAVFGYGSLLSNPIEHINETIFNCTLYGYTKGFICEDFIYRGTTNFTGLTMGLQQDLFGTVKGALLISSGNQIIPFIKAFVKRETPISINGTVMDIYTYDFLKIVMPNGTDIQYALTCVVNTRSLFYSSQQLTLEEQAQKIAQAYGLNGTNLQYLRKVINIYREYNLNDSCTSEIENLYHKVILYRQCLSMSDQQWLEVYDQLQTLEEREQVVRSRASVDRAETPVGALVSVDARSTVGVKYSDLPLDSWDLAIALLNTKDDIFWRSIAVQQFKLTMNRLVFRPLYFNNIQPPKYRGTLSLTLDQFWKIEFMGPPKLVRIDSHYLMVRDFKFHVILITDSISVVKSDDRLSNIGGSFLQNYTLPVDPMLLLQRTGTACMSENGWPPNSMDPETTEYFYDDTCKVENPQAVGIVGCQQCHCQYPLPTISCVEALKAFVGQVKVSLNFTRIKYDKATADEWRFPKEPSINSFGQVAPVNIFEYLPDMQRYRIIYLYIESDGCELVERCVGGSGWRRLLVFSTTAPNFGTQDLRLGSVSYFTNGLPSDLITKYHIFEYSPCHKHFHFSHYGSFAFGNPNDQSNLTNSKRGFCLQAVYCHANAEWSPLHQEYYTCSLQGIPAGWQDVYQGGIRCQWVDVTPINTSVQSYTASLYSSLNPDGFLCEGVPQPNTWIPTEFTTTCCGGNGCCGDSNKTECCGGQPVDRVGCEAWIGAEEDNQLEIPVTLPLSGEGQVTEKCWNSSGSWGEKRDCGLKLHPKGKYLNCKKPGQKVALKKVVTTDFYQVVRICEASIALRTGLACIWNSSLTTVVISHTDKPRDVQFICPPKRDSVEIGGHFSVYYGPLFTDLAFGDFSWSSIG